MLYYEISLRIGKGYEYIEPFYVGNGVVCINAGTTEGYIAKDYITGSISQDKLAISTQDVYFKQGYNLETKGAHNIEVPGQYILYGYTGDLYTIAEITFQKKLPEDKIKDAKEQLEEVKELLGKGV